MLDFLHRNKEKYFILLSLVGKRDFFQRKSKDILKERGIVKHGKN